MCISEKKNLKAVSLYGSSFYCDIQSFNDEEGNKPESK